MNRMVVKAKVSSDGSLHLDLPLGPAEADTEVQVTVESLVPHPKSILLAADLLNSGLVGMWAERNDIGDNHEFARRLREQAQTRKRDI